MDQLRGDETHVVPAMPDSDSLAEEATSEASPESDPSALESISLPRLVRALCKFFLCNEDLDLECEEEFSFFFDGCFLFDFSSLFLASSFHRVQLAM